MLPVSNPECCQTAPTNSENGQFGRLTGVKQSPHLLNSYRKEEIIVPLLGTIADYLRANAEELVLNCID